MDNQGILYLTYNIPFDYTLFSHASAAMKDHTNFHALTGTSSTKTVAVKSGVSEVDLLVAFDTSNNNNQ